MFRYSLKCLVVGMLLGLVSNEDIKSVSRQPKFFTFNADSEDVEVGLDFSIPFLKIPLKKTINAVGQFGFPGISWPKINIDPSALILGGFLIATTSIFAPLLHKATSLHYLDRSSRSAFGNETDPSLYIAEKFLSNSRGCPERIACWSSQRTKNPEVIKALKHIMSNKLLTSMVNTTVLEIATARGRSGHNCELYIPCPIEEKTLPKLIDSLTILTNLNARG